MRCVAFRTREPIHYLAKRTCHAIELWISVFYLSCQCISWTKSICVYRQRPAMAMVSSDLCLKVSLWKKNHFSFWCVSTRQKIVPFNWSFLLRIQHFGSHSNEFQLRQSHCKIPWNWTLNHTNFQSMFVFVLIMKRWASSFEYIYLH